MTKETNHRVLRGGSWGLGAQYTQIVDRYISTSNFRFSRLGFRLIEVKE